MSEALFYSYSGIILLISIACGAAGTFLMFRRGRFADGTFCLAMYIGLPLVLFIGVGPIDRALAFVAPFEQIPAEQRRFAAIFLLSPLLAVWVGWLAFGGFAAVSGDIDISGFVRAHLTSAGLRNKVIGAVLMCCGAAIFSAAFLLPASLFRLPVFAVAFLAYFRGAIYIVFPEEQSLNP